MINSRNRARSNTPYADQAHQGDEQAAKLLRIALAHDINDTSGYKNPSDSILEGVRLRTAETQLLKDQIAAYRAAQEEGYKPAMPDDQSMTRWLPETYEKRRASGKEK